MISNGPFAINHEEKCQIKNNNKISYKNANLLKMDFNFIFLELQDNNIDRGIL